MQSWLGLCMGLRDHQREGALVVLVTDATGPADPKSFAAGLFADSSRGWRPGVLPAAAKYPLGVRSNFSTCARNVLVAVTPKVPRSCLWSGLQPGRVQALRAWRWRAGTQSRSAVRSSRASHLPKSERIPFCSFDPTQFIIRSFAVRCETATVGKTNGKVFLCPNRRNHTLPV